MGSELDKLTDFEYLLDNLYDGVYIVDTKRRITYWNKSAERLTGFSREEVEGSFCFDNKLDHVDGQGNQLCRGNCPLKRAMQDGRFHEDDIYLRQKNGIRRPVSVRVAPIKDENGEVVGAIEVFSDNSVKMSAIEQLHNAREEALLDPLTRVYNRRGLEAAFEDRFRELRSRDLAFGISMTDIDDFKKVNDTYGHQAGDEVLKMISTLLITASRAYDVVGRWGGEEFVTIFGNMTQDLLEQIVERHRMLVEKSFVKVDDQIIRVTMSVGATMVTEEDDIDSIITRADRLLYESKETGKNKVTFG